MGPRLRGNDDVGAKNARVCMAIVGAPHGVRGAVRIKSFTDIPEAVANYGALEDESGARRFTLRVTGAAKGDGMVIGQLSGVVDRDAAEALRGLRLYAPRAALPAPAEDEFYYADLVGLAALLEDGSRLGEVVAVHDFGAGDVIEIARDKTKGQGGQPVLVPFTRAAVPVVDIAGGRVVVAPPDGLIEASGAPETVGDPA
ncbi:MAG TPA: ribosome maturation factor RimM [Stellaceae bacterium]|nr:ribosome maturation factor RimM [Stellaceae bacterium]